MPSPALRGLDAMFKNKHMTIAMIVAPLLAVISYFATDLIVSDLPNTAQAGQAYPMVAKPNCRYQSGHCVLKNGDIEIELRLAAADTHANVNAGNSHVLLARSNVPLKGVKVELVGPDARNEAPKVYDLQAVDGSQQRWHTQLSIDPFAISELRIAMLAHSDATFYASTGTTFFKHDTAFPLAEW